MLDQLDAFAAVCAMVAAGDCLEEIERYIGELQIAEERKEALWLIAWAHCLEDNVCA